MQRLLASFSLLLLPTIALAHSGDHLEATVNHFFASPFHALPIVAIIGIGAYHLVRRTRSKKDQSH